MVQEVPEPPPFVELQSTFIPAEKQNLATTSSTVLYCSCVKYARSLVPELPPGDASQLAPNGPPVVGGIAIMHYGSLYHLGVILSLQEGGFTVTEGNYKRCRKTERFIEWDSREIVGFWSPDGV